MANAPDTAKAARRAEQDAAAVVQSELQEQLDAAGAQIDVLNDQVQDLRTELRQCRLALSTSQQDCNRFKSDLAALHAKSWQDNSPTTGDIHDGT